MSKKKNNEKYIIIAVIIIVLAALGYFVYSRLNTNNSQKVSSSFDINGTGETTNINLSIPKVPVEETPSSLIDTYEKVREDSVLIRNQEKSGIGLLDNVTSKSVEGNKKESFDFGFKESKNQSDNDFNNNSESFESGFTNSSYSSSSINVIIRNYEDDNTLFFDSIKKSIENKFSYKRNPVIKKKKKIFRKKTIKPKVKSFEDKLISHRSFNIKNSNSATDLSSLDDSKGFPVEFSAVINENQEAYNNAMITVRVLEDINYGDNVLLRNTFLYGVATIKETGRVFIKFSNMSVLGNRRKINLSAYDELDGYEGLLISDRETLALLKSESDNQSSLILNQQGAVGTALSSVLRKKRKEIKVELYDEHAIILKGTL